MEKQSIYEAFTINRGTMRDQDIVGLPEMKIIRALKEDLHVIVRYSKSSVSSDCYGLDIAFDPSTRKRRQDVIKRIDEKIGIRGEGYSGDTKAIKAMQEISIKIAQNRGSYEKRIHLISNELKQLYGIVNDYLKEHKEFSDEDAFTELKLRKRSLGRDFEKLFDNIDMIEKMDTFYVTMNDDVTRIIPVFDKGSVPKSPKIDIGYSYHIGKLVIPIKETSSRKMVKATSDIASNFRRGIISRLESEMYYQEDDDKTIRYMMDELLTPAVLFEAYKKYVNRFIIDESTSLSSKWKFTYPKFENRFDIKNMFPLTLKNEYVKDVGYIGCGEFTPLNFNTDRKESKFLFVGLNSGGKSFLLENLAVAAIIGSAGLPLPADEAVLPDYKRLTYYNNTHRKSFGKFETEMADISKICSKAKKGDLIIVDNFFEGGTPQVTTHLAPKFLDKLTDTKATILVESHAPLDLDHFEDRDWVTYSPVHIEKGGKIIPTFGIERGRPDTDVMVRYANQLARKHLSKASDDDSNEEDTGDDDDF